MVDRLNQAVAELEEQLLDPIDVAALARTALTSEHHFRRMFSALAGMPLSEYVRRRRMTLAGAEVMSGEYSLLDIAVRYGYGSGEAFARAFRAVHGVGPQQARRDGMALVLQPRITFRIVVEGSTSMEYRLVQLEELRIVGYRARVPLIYEGVNPAMSEFVEGLGQPALAAIGALSDAEPAGLLSVVDNIDESRAEGSELDYWMGAVSTADAPEGADVLAIPAGEWVVLSNSGPFPEAMQRLWHDAYSEWFPAHPYRTRPGPEILQTVYAEDGTSAEASLWLPVEREG